MTKFYAKIDDDDRCRQSLREKQSITISGLDLDGKLRIFTGTVKSVEEINTGYPSGYPIKVTISDANTPPATQI